MEQNILIVGVGGQGTLLASRVLGAIAVLVNKDCKLSEVHGMSQRGGSVVTHARIGEKVDSPIIPVGGADYIIAFEELEALRWNHFLKEDGLMLVNVQRMMPMPVITGMAEYPKEIFKQLDDRNKKVMQIEGLKLASEAGNSKAVNVVMIGALCNAMGVSYDIAKQAVTQCVPARLLEINLTALQLGYNL
ncbi:MAG: indolepyruvate oxidoreductase subunit beta [Bacillota bacterium]